MREFTGAHPDWLTVIQLPAYAPDLNACEGVWANIKNGLGNLAACTADQLAAIVRNRLKRIQYRPALIDGFLAQTGLTLEPEPPWNSDLGLSTSVTGSWLLAGVLLICRNEYFFRAHIYARIAIFIHAASRAFRLFRRNECYFLFRTASSTSDSF